ncbi:MAG: TonB-dependent receptor [Calditrichia bacterium]
MKRFILCVLCTMYFSMLSAQQTGSIIGRVVDKNTQQPLIGANVSVIGDDRGASTDKDGVFRIGDLEEDFYKLRIDYIGYVPLVQPNIRVVRNKSSQIDKVEMVASVIEGDEISVSAGIFREDQESIVSGTHYNREEIRRSPGSANDVLRAIATIPGVSNSGGEYAAYSVRGSSPRDNLILVDNIPFEKVVHFDGSPNEYEDAQGGGFSIFTPYLIEEAEFQGGGFSARYGGKHSSLLRLGVKEGNKENRTIRGTYDLLGWELNYDGPAHLIKNTRLNLSARHQDFKRVIELAGFEEFGYPRLTDLIGKMTTDINPNNTISLLGVFGPEKFDRDVTHMLASDDMDDTFLADTDETRSLLGLNWRMLTGRSSFLHSTLYYRHNDQVRQYGKAYLDLANGEVPTVETIRQRPDIYSLNQQETELGSKIDFTWQTQSNSTFRAGVELNRIGLDVRQTQNGLDTLYTYDQNDFRADPTQNYIVTRPEDINARFDDTKSVFSMYSEYGMNLLSGRLLVTPGIRYQYSEFSKDHYVLPRFSSSIRINQKSRLNLAIGLYSQTPRFIDLVSDVNNNGLKDELSAHYILGLTRYLRDDLKFTAEVYYKSFDELVVQSDRTVETRTNAGEGWASGVDFSLVKRLVDKVYGQLNYSYALSERDDNNGLGSYDHDFNRPHIFNLLFGYEHSRSWAFSMKWNYTSGQLRNGFIIHEDVHGDRNLLRYSQEITSRNSDRKDAIHSLNIRADYRYQIRRLGIIAFLDIFNIYNNTNANQERFVDRSGEIVDVGLGIVPTFGFKFEL